MKRKILAVMLGVSLTFVPVTTMAQSEEQILEESDVNGLLPDETEEEENSEAEPITDKESIRMVQCLLNFYGYDCGTPDGVAGQRTKDAVMDYQQNNGMKADGIITKAFFLSLYLDITTKLSSNKIDADAVLERYESNNSSCQSAYQQSANGAYRLLELFTVMAMNHDKKGEYSYDISQVRLELILQEELATTALQQEVNGLYRSVEMLAILARELDTYGIYENDIDRVIESRDTQNESCQSAIHQVVNGEYRSVELLGIIAAELDSKGKYVSRIDNVINNLILHDDSSTGAPQQAVNGSYRMYELLKIIAEECDQFRIYSSIMSDLDDTFIANDSSASSAPQQEVNGLYRSVEIAYIITQTM